MCTHEHTWAQTQIHMDTHIFTHRHRYTGTQTNIHTDTHKHTQGKTYSCSHMHRDTLMLSHMSAHTYHTGLYKHTHTHTSFLIFQYALPCFISELLVLQYLSECLAPLETLDFQAYHSIQRFQIGEPSSKHPELQRQGFMKQLFQR